MEISFLIFFFYCTITCQKSQYFSAYVLICKKVFDAGLGRKVNALLFCVACVMTRECGGDKKQWFRR